MTDLPRSSRRRHSGLARGRRTRHPAYWKPLEVIERGEIDRLWQMIFDREVRCGKLTVWVRTRTSCACRLEIFRQPAAAVVEGGTDARTAVRADRKMLGCRERSRHDDLMRFDDEKENRHRRPTSI